MRASKLAGRMETVYRVLLICLLAVGIGLPTAGAQEDRPRWIITAECRMIQVPAKGALALIEELSDEATIDAAWKRVQERVESGEIENVATVVAKGSEGEKLLAQTGEHLLYPTEYDTPKVPDNIPEENGVDALKAWPFIGLAPTAYESRHLGQELELTAGLAADGKWIDATVSVQHLRLVRWVKYDAGRLSDGERLTVEQPVFHTMKNTGKMYLRNGQRILLGVHKSADPAAKTYELFILRITASPAGPKK